MPRPFQGDHIEGTSQTSELDPIEIPPFHSATPGAMMFHQRKHAVPCVFDVTVVDLSIVYIYIYKCM